MIKYPDCSKEDDCASMGKTEKRLKSGAVLFWVPRIEDTASSYIFGFHCDYWLLAMALPSAGNSPSCKPADCSRSCATGGVFAGAGVLSFLRARTTISPSEPSRSTSLVTSGVYSLTRNPMYLSLLLVLVAWAVYLSNLAAMVLIPCFAAYLTRFQIMPEERVLASCSAAGSRNTAAGSGAGFRRNSAGKPV